MIWRSLPSAPTTPALFRFPRPGSFLSAAGWSFSRVRRLGTLPLMQAQDLLETTARRVGHGGSMLLGVDLKKDKNALDAAYNDSRGVTADFNLNLLERMNRELGAEFRPREFSARRVL